MKLFSFTLLLVSFCAFVNGQNKSDYGLLLRPGEKALYSFSLKSNNKTVLICTGKDDNYIVYRFGTKDKVELQYPTVLAPSSWKTFKYDGYSRGGVGNSPEELHSITFSNNHITYNIYDDWDGDGNAFDTGIIIITNGKKIKLIGNSSSRVGTLGVLSDKAKLIPNHYWNDNK